MQDKQFHFAFKRGQRWMEMAPTLLLMSSFSLPPWWPYWPWALLGAGLCAISLWRILRAAQIERLVWLQSERFCLYLRDGSECGVCLQNAFVHPRLLALRFRADDGRRYHLLRWTPPAEAERYRHLRIILLHQSARSAAPANPYA